MRELLLMILALYNLNAFALENVNESALENVNTSAQENINTSALENVIQTIHIINNSDIPLTITFTLYERFQTFTHDYVTSATLTYVPIERSQTITLASKNDKTGINQKDIDISAGNTVQAYPGLESVTSGDGEQTTYFVMIEQITSRLGNQTFLSQPKIRDTLKEGNYIFAPDTCEANGRINGITLDNMGTNKIFCYSVKLTD